MVERNNKEINLPRQALASWKIPIGRDVNHFWKWETERDAIHIVTPTAHPLKSLATSLMRERENTRRPALVYPTPNPSSSKDVDPLMWEL